jgi:hypothetical protein
MTGQQQNIAGTNRGWLTERLSTERTPADRKYGLRHLRSAVIREGRQRPRWEKPEELQQTHLGFLVGTIVEAP